MQKNIPISSKIGIFLYLIEPMFIIACKIATTTDFTISSRRDLNSRPLPYQGNALPTELRGHIYLIQIF